MPSQPVIATHFQPLCPRCLGDLGPSASHCPRCHFEVDPPWSTAILETIIEHGPEIYCGVVLWITVLCVLVSLALIAGAGAGLVM